MSSTESIQSIHPAYASQGSHGPEEQAVAVFRGPHQNDTEIHTKIRDLEALLARIARDYPRVALASSLAAEDNILFDAIARLQLPISVFSLNTGRLHAETLNTADALATRYGKTVQWFYPQEEAVTAYVNSHGPDAFYESVYLRKACCGIRKVEPLNRALQGLDAWLTGQRQAQAATRSTLPVQELDAERGLQKFNPLAAWSEADVWTYIRQFNVPVNPLHLQGFPSIGCQPCTRAITLGEDIRAGRWWWEDPANKECGLHSNSSQNA
jgi:phosphoadenosine phosphosulfate reductase